eukprot:1157316-Pelagomonas_calceolata.AAC.4
METPIHKLRKRRRLGLKSRDSPSPEEKRKTRRVIYGLDLPLSCFSTRSSWKTLWTRLLRPQDGVLLLADPPNRTVANRERFMHLVAGGRGDEDDTETDGEYEDGLEYVTRMVNVRRMQI